MLRTTNTEGRQVVAQLVSCNCAIVRYSLERSSFSERDGNMLVSVKVIVKIARKKPNYDT